MYSESAVGHVFCVTEWVRKGSNEVVFRDFVQESNLSRQSGVPGSQDVARGVMYSKRAVAVDQKLSDEVVGEIAALIERRTLDSGHTKRFLKESPFRSPCRVAPDWLP